MNLCTTFGSVRGTRTRDEMTDEMGSRARHQNRAIYTSTKASTR